MRTTTGLLTLLALLTGCDSSTTSAWTTVSAADRSAAQTSQLEDALGARDALFQALLGELMGTIKEVGAAGAIDVCSEIAPRLAGEVGAERGLTIGRTSTQLRNASRPVPDWAAYAIDEHASPTETVTVAHTDGRLGALLPIFVMEPCLKCHGPTKDLGEGVAAALAKAYPDDQATGYASGDLRGWFWVEVNPQAH